MFLKIFEDKALDGSLFLRWKDERVVVDEAEGKKEENRRLLVLLYRQLLAFCSAEQVRRLWHDEAKVPEAWDLPLVIGQDPFLSMFAQGKGVQLSLFRRVYKRAQSQDFGIPSPSPIFVGETEDADKYYGVKSIPPGLRAKFFSYWRKKRDPELLLRVQSDFYNVSQIPDKEKRAMLTLAILSHGAAYRELDGNVLRLPSLAEDKKGILVPYALREHLLWEGVKTVSLTPLEKENVEPGIYLCQGTEIWPSQPLTLGSIVANLGILGSATEPYAHAWRQIHKHLRDLYRKGGILPYVSGHSMGGALASQIAIYSHPLLAKAYAFNPPVVEERDYQVYHRLSPNTQSKLLVFANIDDLPFWRIGSKVIGKVHLLFGEKRWKHYSFKKIERFLILPALIKAYRNLWHIVPSHQNIIPLMRSYCIAHLSQEEIDVENEERATRENRLSFFPKFYRLVRFLMEFRRKHFFWEKRREYILSQLEINELHAQDLQETYSITNSDDIKREIEELATQRTKLLEDLEHLR